MIAVTRRSPRSPPSRRCSRRPSHRHEEGNLDSDPMVVAKSGHCARAGGKSPLVYVVGVELTGKPTGTRGAAHRRLDQLTDAVHAALRTAAGR